MFSISSRRRKIKRATFQHQKLENFPFQIRVVQVLPEKSHDGLLQCKLQHIPLTKSDSGSEFPYSCLSYRWRSDQPLHTILINDVTFKVHSNLYEFMDQIRKRYSSWLPSELVECPHLWIDAICINQKDDCDRTRQVPLMGEIYSSAERVYIWLGSGSRSSDWLLRSQIRKNAYPGSPWTGVWKQHALEVLLTPLHLPSLRERYLKLWDVVAEELLHLTRGNPLINKLADNDYWKRAWICQELLLARKAIVCHGSISVDFEEFSKFHVQIPHRTSNWGVDSWMPASHHATELPLAKSRQLNLSKNLTSFKRRQCSVVHDHVYAFVGMSRNATSFPVDYGCSRLELLINTMAFCCVDLWDTDMPPPTVVYFSGQGSSNSTPRKHRTYDQLAAVQRLSALAVRLWKILEVEVEVEVDNQCVRATCQGVSLPRFESGDPKVRVKAPYGGLNLPLATVLSFVFTNDSHINNRVELYPPTSKWLFNSITTSEARHSRLQKHDMLMYSTYPHIILVARKVRGMYVLVGRMACPKYVHWQTQTADESWDHRYPEYDRYEYEWYPNGLFNTHIVSEDLPQVRDQNEQDSPHAVAEPDFYEVLLRFDDIRPILVLFALPEGSRARRIAISMMEEHSGSRICDELTFGSETLPSDPWLSRRGPEYSMDEASCWATYFEVE